MTFDVNGFSLDKRQVSPEGVDADPLEPVALLVFSPGIYSVSVDTPISATRGVAVLSDSPMANVPVELQAFATPQFVEIVQERVEEFLTSCATQEVLQPTACPFGFFVQDRIVSPPAWSITAQPTVSVVPDGAGWRMPAAQAVAHIEVDIRSLFDGSVRDVSRRRAVHRDGLHRGAARRHRLDHDRRPRLVVSGCRSPGLRVRPRRAASAAAARADLDPP